MGRAPGGVTPHPVAPIVAGEAAAPAGPREALRGTLVQAVEATLRRHALLAPGHRVLVAVSGGADSVALLHVLWLLREAWGLDLRVGHVHHGLRPEADADAAFVEAYAARLGCPATTARVTIEAGRGRSPEEAARTARHAALAALADRHQADRVALGHTADDQTETVLMRVLQGAGPRGLAGIPIRRGRLVRPLLHVDRASIHRHLATFGLDHVEDLTNLDPRFARNGIRHDLLPALTRLVGPGLPRALDRLARASRETIEALEDLLAPRLRGALHPVPGGWEIAGAALAGLPPGATKALLRLALARRAGLAGLRASHLDALAGLLAAPSGAQVRLPGGARVERTRRGLFLAPAGPPASPAGLPVPGAARADWAWLEIEAGPDTVDGGAGERGGQPEDQPDAWGAQMDADALPARLEIRPSQPGQRMRLEPGAAPVRLSRLLSEAGVARLARGTWPVLVDPVGGEALWLIGLRQGAGARVTPATRRVLRFRARLTPPA